MGTATQELIDTSKGEENGAGEQAARDSVIHGLGVKAISRVTGNKFTAQEERDIVRDAMPPEPFGSAAKTPVIEYGPEDQVPFGD
jgi:hypothetical protein